MRSIYSLLFSVLFLSTTLAQAVDNEQEIFLGINTADVREDTSSVQFLNLFSSAIPFSETVPWGSSKQVTYDENGWPNDLKEGQAGTKFLNRLPEDTVEDGFFTVLYDGEGEIFYGNDARLVVHRPNKDIIEIRAGKDKILNASLFIKKSNPGNYIRNLRILPEGGICKGAVHTRVKSPDDCNEGEFLSFEDNHLNPWASEQREALAKDTEEEKNKNETKESNKEKDTKEIKKTVYEKDQTGKDKAKNGKQDDKNDKAVVKEESTETKTEVVTSTNTKNIIDKDAFVIKGFTDPNKALLFNPEYLNFIKDFQMVRFMNMQGMTRNPVVDWDKRNSLKKATWGG